MFEEVTPDLITAVAAVVGGSIGLHQYSVSQRWNRVRLAGELIERFYNDETNRLAISLLDWTEKQITLPSRFQRDPDTPARLAHSHAKLSRAFAMSSRMIDEKSNTMEMKPELLTTDLPIYVEIFDSFFSDITRMHTFVEQGLVRPKELKVIAYWFDKVETATYDGQNVFLAYLKYYQYDEVLDLFAKLKRVWRRRIKL